MAISLILLLASLLLILFAAEGFTNGIEVFGRRFSFSQAVVGSILAAVGTALPETILPMVAIFFGNHATAKDIGVGAILGAPFMLSTVAFFLVGVTVIVSHMRKHRAFDIAVEAGPLKRDLGFFIVMYASAIFLPIAFGRSWNALLALVLVAGYICYVVLTVRGESSCIEHFEGLHLLRVYNAVRGKSREQAHVVLILFQIAAALLVMVAGAHVFVRAVEVVSARLGMDPLLFALLVAPIATELPEKFNSVTWILKKKDALAVGNITGALVFQSTFPVSLGLLFTSWKIDGMALFSAVLALTSAAVVFLVVLMKKRLSPLVMLAGGVLYLVYALALIFRR